MKPANFPQWAVRTCSEGGGRRGLALGRQRGHLDQLGRHQRAVEGLHEFSGVQRLVHGNQRVHLSLGDDARPNGVRLRALDVADEVGVAEVPPRLRQRLPAHESARDVVRSQDGVVCDEGAVGFGSRVALVLVLHAVDEVVRVERVAAAAGLVHVAVRLRGDVRHMHDIVGRTFQPSLAALEHKDKD